MKRLLSFPSLIVAIYALKCYDTRTENTCEGDFCYVIPARMINTHGDYVTAFTERGCLRGNLLADLNNTCWQDDLFVYCICDHDYCDYGFMQTGNLNCTEGATKKCIACEQTSSKDGRIQRGCRDDTMKGIDRLMRPQSCVRFETSQYDNDIKCLCDTGDNCDDMLINEQVLDTGSLNCSMKTVNSKEDLMCTGQYCFITSESETGCITNNETLSAGLYKASNFPGTFTFDGIEYIVCNTNNCNADFKEALEYAATAVINAPSPIRSLTSSTPALTIYLTFFQLFFIIFVLLRHS